MMKKKKQKNNRLIWPFSFLSFFSCSAAFLFLKEKSLAAHYSAVSKRVKVKVNELNFLPVFFGSLEAQSKREHLP